MEALKTTKLVAFVLMLMMLLGLSFVSNTPAANAATTLPEWTTFQGSGPGVWLRANGGVYSVPNPETLTRCLGGWGNVRHLTDAQVSEVLSAYPSHGSAACRVDYPNLTTLQAPSSGTVYVISGGRKYGVPNPETLIACLGGWGAVRHISDAEMAWTGDFYPDGGIYRCPVSYANGTLLQASGPGVVVISHTNRLNIPNPTVLNCYGGWARVRRISDAEWAQMTATYPDAGTAPGCTSQPPGLPASARNIGYNPFAARYSNQCTYYAEQRMANHTGRYMPVYGNAYQWAAQARSGGWTVGSSPAVNSVVVFPAGSFGSSVGHVAWVVAISGNRIRIQDYNWNWVGARVTDHWVTVPGGTQYIYSDR